MILSVLFALFCFVCCLMSDVPQLVENQIHNISLFGCGHLRLHRCYFHFDDIDDGIQHFGFLQAEHVDFVHLLLDVIGFSLEIVLGRVQILEYERNEMGFFS